MSVLRSSPAVSCLWAPQVPEEVNGGLASALPRTNPDRPCYFLPGCRGEPPRRSAGSAKIEAPASGPPVGRNFTFYPSASKLGQMVSEGPQGVSPKFQPISMPGSPRYARRCRYRAWSCAPCVCSGQRPGHAPDFLVFDLLMFHNVYRTPEV